MNNEQKRRRKGDDVNARFDVIELFLFRLYTAASGKLPDAALIEEWPVYPYCRDLTRSCNVSFEHEDDESIALRACIRDKT